MGRIPPEALKQFQEDAVEVPVKDLIKFAGADKVII
jgi:hypothetical protein